MNIDGTETFDEDKIANGFNKFFSTIGPNLAGKINLVNKKFQDYMTTSKNIFSTLEASETDLKSAFKSLKPDKSPGHDYIHVNVVKNNMDNFLKPLLHIFNLSLSNGIFPDMM